MEISSRILNPIFLVSAIFLGGCSNPSFSQVGYLVYEVSTPIYSSQIENDFLETPGTPAPTLNLATAGAITSSNARFQIVRKDDGMKGRADLKIIDYIKTTLDKNGAKKYEINVFDSDQNRIFSGSGELEERLKSK